MFFFDYFLMGVYYSFILLGFLSVPTLLFFLYRFYKSFSEFQKQKNEMI